MVMCGILIEEKDEAKLKAIGVKDSKLLTKDERENLYGKILDIVKKYKIVIFSVQEVDDAVNGKGGLNLNWLEATSTAKILNELNPDEAIVDSPSPNLTNYRNYVHEKLDSKKMKLKFEHKADLHYPVVSAASILAKVTRDNEIEKIRKEIRIDFGSGYMSDPRTVDFLKNNYENHSNLFRKSWLPYKDMVNKKFQKNLSDFSAFLKEEKKHDGHTIEDLKKLEEHGFVFHAPKSEHELAVMKGPCTIILYKNGNLLVQGKPEEKKICEKILGLK